MLGKPLADFYELRGFKVLEFQGTYWTPFRPGSPFLMSFPENATVHAPSGDVAEFLARNGSWAARYPTAGQLGTPSGYYVFRQKSYGLERLGASAKRSVRKGLDRCRIVRLSPSDLRVAALEINQQTLTRQERNEPEFSNPAHWGRFLDAVEKVPAIQLTGALVDGKLVSYSVDCRDGAWTYGLHQFSRNECRKDFVNHALDFHLAQEAAADPAVIGMTNGPVPVRPAEGLHTYKTSMGYEIEPQRVAIRFRDPLQTVLASEPAVALCGWASERWHHPQLSYLAQVLATARGEPCPLSETRRLVEAGRSK